MVAASLLVVSAIVINRLDAYFRDQEQTALEARSTVVARLVVLFAGSAASPRAVVEAGNTLNPDVEAALSNTDFLTFLTDQVALADVTIQIGGATPVSADSWVVTPASNGTFSQALTAEPEPGQAREPLSAAHQLTTTPGDPLRDPWGVVTTLANPYTTRASTLATITGLLAITALGAIVITLIISTYLAARFTRPLRRLGDATRRLGAGDLSGRVPAAELESSYAEVADLARQFNAMADRLEESIELIRRDRDRSRDFLADVSHELRTPLAAVVMNTELLQGAAGADPTTRAEFLATSRQQPDRLDWLAQNLLELSKLESGLLRLDLRPDDLRSTVESAFEQADPGARRRAARLTSPWSPTAREPASRSGTPASGSTPARFPTSSTASTAARGPTRHAARGAALASRSSSRSWTCTAAASPWRAASAPGAPSP